MAHKNLKYAKMKNSDKEEKFLKLKEMENEITKNKYFLDVIIKRLDNVEENLDVLIQRKKNRELSPGASWCLLYFHYQRVNMIY